MSDGLHTAAPEPIWVIHQSLFPSIQAITQLTEPFTGDASADPLQEGSPGYPPGGGGGVRHEGGLPILSCRVHVYSGYIAFDLHFKLSTLP